MKTNADLLREYAALPTKTHRYGGIDVEAKLIPAGSAVVLARAAKQLDMQAQEIAALRRCVHVVPIPFGGKCA